MLPHHKKTEEHGTFSHIHIVIIKSKPCVLGTHTISHHAWELKSNILCGKICSGRCVVLLLHSQSVICIFSCWAIDSTTQNLVHNMQQIVVFRSGSRAMAFSSLTMSVRVGLRWASGSPSTNLSELFVHCWYFLSQIPAQHQTHLILLA